MGGIRFTEMLLHAESDPRGVADKWRRITPFLPLFDLLTRYVIFLRQIVNVSVEMPQKTGHSTEPIKHERNPIIRKIS